MERKLIDYLPYVIRDYAEFQGIMGSEQPEIEKAWNTTDDLLDNQFIPTAGNMGLSRWEKILGITPKGTDSLEDRRFRILKNFRTPCPSFGTSLKRCAGRETIPLMWKKAPISFL